jgi:hypothetical protein
MLETIREDALERLDEQGQLEDARNRHLNRYVELAETAEPELTRASEAVWLERLSEENDNIRAALAWSFESGQVELGLRLAGALVRFWSIRGLMTEGPQAGRLQRVFSDFLLERSLRFLCQSCSYLAKGADAPLAGLSDPWETIAGDAEQFKLNWEQASAKLASEDRYAAPGVYILAGGALVEATQDQVVPKKLDATDLPLVCVNLPGTFVSTSHAFHIDPEAGGSVVNVVRISDRSLRAFGPAVFARLVEQLKRRLADQFAFDVFISYSHRDEAVAGAWRTALEQAGLRVYMSRPDAMRKFKKEIELALAESLVMMPFVSDRAAGPDGQKGWVQREIEYRKTLFDEDHCNILPIELTRGLAELFADGFSALAWLMWTSWSTPSAR